MLPIKQKYTIEEQDQYFKSIYNDLSIIYEQSEQSFNFEDCLTPLKQSLVQIYELQDQKYQSSTEEESNSYNNFSSCNETMLQVPSMFKRKGKTGKNQDCEMNENIGNEADDTKNIQFPFELCVKLLEQLQQRKFQDKQI